MFRGSATAKIDAKGRFKVPRDFLRVLEENWGPRVFTTSVRGDVGLFYPLPVWEDIEARLQTLPSTDNTRRRYLQRVSYYGQQGELDAQGRIVIPQVLRESAGLSGEAVVCGIADHLEIWDRKRFEAGLKDDPFTDEDFGVLAEKGV